MPTRVNEELKKQLRSSKQIKASGKHLLTTHERRLIRKGKEA